MSKKRSLALVWMGRLLQVLVMGGIIVGAVAISSYWLGNRPKAKRIRRPKKPPLVEIRTLEPVSHEPKIRGLGNVIAAREVKISSLVSGRVKWVAPTFFPGGRFKVGDKVIEVEPAEYMYNYEVRKGELDRARADLAIEVGKRSVAERELKLMDKGISGANKDLILRKPQEASVKAAVEAARASASKAWLDVKRTRVHASFNGMLQEKKVDVGSKITLGTDCGTIIGTDVFWIEVMLPRTYLGLFRIPGYNGEKGALVHVIDREAWSGRPHAFRIGHVLRLLPDLDKDSKLMRVLVEVKDPLHLSQPAGKRLPLLVGAMVHVIIYGQEMQQVFEIHRDWERDGALWILGSDSKLEIRKVKSLWRGRSFIYFRDGLKAGEKIVVSNLGFATEKMQLRERKAEKSKGGPK